MTDHQHISHTNDPGHDVPPISNFSAHLFWDVDRDELNIDEDDHYIIKQVLEYGLMNDWNLISAYYGLERIANISATFRELDKKALSFISSISKKPIQEFRCYNYQRSIPPHWNF